MVKRKISQQDAEHINVQGAGNTTVDGSVNEDKIQQEEVELDSQNGNGGDMEIDMSEEDRRMITEMLRSLKSGGNNPVNFKKANRRQLEEITNRVNKILDKLPTRTITETNNLINAVSIYVATELALKKMYRGRASSHGGKGGLKEISKCLEKRLKKKVN